VWKGMKREEKTKWEGTSRNFVQGPRVPSMPLSLSRCHAIGNVSRIRKAMGKLSVDLHTYDLHRQISRYQVGI
jgi:hypothetical protein